EQFQRLTQYVKRYVNQVTIKARTVGIDKDELQESRIKEKAPGRPVTHHPKTDRKTGRPGRSSAQRKKFKEDEYKTHPNSSRSLESADKCEDKADENNKDAGSRDLIDRYLEFLESFTPESRK
ncbi:19163_t:CDS:2, partial [Racocetra persica]